MNADQYSNLKVYSDKRRSELSADLIHLIEYTDKVGKYICELVEILGEIQPVGVQDKSIRDLIADSFDNLYASRDFILTAQVNVAYPILRRAFESISLMHLMTLDEKWAEKWSGGKQLTNGTVREELGKHPKGEKKEHLKEYYDYFCLGTHPNREMIPVRHLGAGSKFVLGSIGSPNPIQILNDSAKLIELWGWLLAVSAGFNFKSLEISKIREYKELRTQGGLLKKEITDALNKEIEQLAADKKS